MNERMNECMNDRTVVCLCISAYSYLPVCLHVRRHADYADIPRCVGAHVHMQKYADLLVSVLCF